MKHTNFTTIAESEWSGEHRQVLKDVARQLDRILRRRLNMAECHALYRILTLFEFTLCDGTVINGLDGEGELGNREAAAIAGCFHEGEHRHDAQWWYFTMLRGGGEDTADPFYRMLGEIVASLRVRNTR